MLAFNSLHIDSRSLCLFRRCASLLLMWDLVTLIPDTTAFFTDLGVLPRHLLLQHILRPHEWSFFLLNGTKPWALALLSLLFFATTSLFFGFRARLSCITCWVLVCSLQLRNPSIIDGSDDYLRLLLFWGMFLPLNNKRVRVISSGGAKGILFQVFCVYFFSSLIKLQHPAWNSSGEALWSAMRLQYSGHEGISGWFTTHPELCALLNHAILAFELAAPILLFVPLRIVRIITLVGLFSFHAMVSLTLQLHYFSAVALTGLTLFIPSQIWNFISKSLGLLQPHFAVERGTRFGEFISLSLIAYTAWWNFAGINRNDTPWFNTLAFVGEISQLHQRWQMYSAPGGEYHWDIVAGELDEGRSYNTLNGRSENLFQEPKNVLSAYGSRHWWNLFHKIPRSLRSDFLARYPDHLCQHWSSPDTKKKPTSIIWTRLSRKLAGQREISTPQVEIVTTHACRV